MDEASSIGGCVSTGPGSVTASRTNVERWSMVTTSLPCSTCAGSTTTPLGVTTPTERWFRSPPAASSCSGVGFISMVSGSPRVRGVSGVMLMVSGSKVVPLGAATSLGASLLTETLNSAVKLRHTGDSSRGISWKAARVVSHPAVRSARPTPRSPASCQDPALPEWCRWRFGW